MDHKFLDDYRRKKPLQKDPIPLPARNGVK
jgi:hypothetical protein